MGFWWRVVFPSDMVVVEYNSQLPLMGEGAAVVGSELFGALMEAVQRSNKTLLLAKMDLSDMFETRIGEVQMLIAGMAAVVTVFSVKI